MKDTEQNVFGLQQEVDKYKGEALQSDVNLKALQYQMEAFQKQQEINEFSNLAMSNSFQN